MMVFLMHIESKRHTILLCGMTSMVDTPTLYFLRVDLKLAGSD